MTSIARMEIGQEIAIHGVTYVVTMFETADEKRAKYPNTARSFDKYQIRAEVGLRRPKGRKWFNAFLYNSGEFSRPMQMN